MGEPGRPGAGGGYSGAGKLKRAAVFKVCVGKFVKRRAHAEESARTNLPTLRIFDNCSARGHRLLAAIVVKAALCLAAKPASLNVFHQ